MRFRKKPVVITAVRYDGNFGEISRFCGGKAVIAIGEGLRISTLEGNMLASHGDWIIRGVKGEFYPCKPDVFEQTYEKVEDSQ